ncbi:SurA N-terminal domain-containing protein [Streptomyces sp. NPDC058657]|uniref:SurA N-terminal domain-containing protein n=1 Tax=unclassified Streptomyces TaxID=2593676 RepID=UPI003666D949
MHRRTRTRTTLLLSAGLLVAAPLLTACGNDAHPGAAALVDGERIEVSSLQGQVRDVRDAQAKTPQAAQLISNTGQLGRAKLHSMIFARVVERAAADAGLTASRKEIQDARAAAAGFEGGDDKVAAKLLGQGYAPDQIEQALRQEILLTKLAAANQADLASPEGQQKVTAVLVKASKALKINVNPRYGSWNNEQIGLAAYRTPWITQRTKSVEAEEAREPAGGPEGTDEGHAHPEGAH